MTHRFFLEKKKKLLIGFHSFISSVIQKSYDFTNFILKIDVYKAPPYQLKTGLRNSKSTFYMNSMIRTSYY